MSRDEVTTSREASLISVRKLAALDIALHGSWVILAEFAIAVCIGAALGFLILLHEPSPSFLGVLAGCYFLGVGVNYVALLLYALNITRSKSVTREANPELADKDEYARKYMLQSMLLIPAPFSLAVLAMYQEWQR